MGGLAALLKARAAAKYSKQQSSDNPEPSKGGSQAPAKRQRQNRGGAFSTKRGNARRRKHEAEEEEASSEDESTQAHGEDAYRRLIELVAPSNENLSESDEEEEEEETDFDDDQEEDETLLADDASVGSDEDIDEIAHDIDDGLLEADEPDASSSASEEEEEEDGFVIVEDTLESESGLPARDGVQDRLETVLSKERAAELMSGKGRRLMLVDTLEDVVQAAWPETSLFASGDWAGVGEGSLLSVTKSVPTPKQKKKKNIVFPQSLASYPGLKERLVNRFRAMPPGHEAGAELERNPEQAALFALLQTGADLLHAARPYPTSPDPEAVDPELDAVLLHVMQTCYSQLDLVRVHDDRLRKGDAEPGSVAPDQGFTRPKVLFLLPMRNLAYRVVMRLAHLAAVEGKGGMPGKARFVREYGPEAEPEELRAAAAAATAKGRPPEQAALFMGNTDDHFRLGIRLGKASMRLNTDLSESDIIIASPLNLATAAGEGSAVLDFLSSVSLVILDRADVALMQNWEHVQTTFQALNRVPKTQISADILRLRPWFADGWAGCYRQTVVLSSFLSPEMLALARRHSCSHRGALRLQRRSVQGVLPRVLPQLRQVFERLPRCLPEEEADLRFAHFKSVLWPRIKEGARQGGQVIYVPSYFDFVRVRNFLRQEKASLLAVSEYTDPSDLTRARQYFQDGRRKLLLFTERAQFNGRPRLRGIRDLHFYQLPMHALFYEELLNQVQESEAGGLPTVTTMFSALDLLRLERVVGAKRADRMVQPKANATFLFC